MLEIPEDFPPDYRNPTVFTFALGFSGILFAFGGAAVFPTIQNDMADSSLIIRSVVVAFISKEKLKKKCCFLGPCET